MTSKFPADVRAAFVQAFELAHPGRSSGRVIASSASGRPRLRVLWRAEVTTLDVWEAEAFTSAVARGYRGGFDGVRRYLFEHTGPSVDLSAPELRAILAPWAFNPRIEAPPPEESWELLLRAYERAASLPAWWQGARALGVTAHTLAALALDPRLHTPGGVQGLAWSEDSGPPPGTFAEWWAGLDSEARGYAVSRAVSSPFLPSPWDEEKGPERRSHFLRSLRYAVEEVVGEALRLPGVEGSGLLDPGSAAGALYFEDQRARIAFVARLRGYRRDAVPDKANVSAEALAAEARAAGRVLSETHEGEAPKGRKWREALANAREHLRAQGVFVERRVLVAAELATAQWFETCAAHGDRWPGVWPLP